MIRSNARQTNGIFDYFNIQQILDSVEEMRANDLLNDQIRKR
jgi:hypothetical protein